MPSPSLPQASASSCVLARGDVVSDMFMITNTSNAESPVHVIYAMLEGREVSCL